MNINYNTIILPPSIELREEWKKIPCKIWNIFDLCKADDVYEYVVNEGYIDENSKQPKQTYNELDKAFYKMDMFFSYQEILDLEEPHRSLIVNSIETNTYPHADLKYHRHINGKNVLMVDDGNTATKDSIFAVKTTFKPRLLDVFSL